MGHEVEYRLFFTDKNSYDEMLSLLNKKDFGQNINESWDIKEGWIELIQTHSYSFRFKDFLEKNNFKGKCTINIYYLEREPDKIEEYTGNKK